MRPITINRLLVAAEGNLGTRETSILPPKPSEQTGSGEKSSEHGCAKFSHDLCPIDADTVGLGRNG
jgi:hypothetical protein